MRTGYGVRIARDVATGLACLALATSLLYGQTTPNEAHLKAALAAAGTGHLGLFDRTCKPIPDPPSAASSAPPPRADWHAEPMKVFDNLYFVGTIELSAWAITTAEGIIVLDPLYDYAVEDEVVGGLRTLGLDPTKIKYVVVSHAHNDHVGGARYLQDHFGARVLMSAEDWQLVAAHHEGYVEPKRDRTIKDGQKLRLGETTLTFYLTPGHTGGTVSTLIPVTDHGEKHLVAAWGGTAFNWTRPSRKAVYITPQRPEQWWFLTYADSARKFRSIAKAAGADVILSNHTVFDGSKLKLPAVANRTAGEPHPFVVGHESVQRYLTVAEECARAWVN